MHRLRVPASSFLRVGSFALFASFAVTLPARAAEPFLKKGDVIALVGGEDMVVAGELGYLELLLTRALPEFHLRFRNLAWEGDTVFAQRRDLNFPPLEAQLDQVGATVVICQFGQMESLGKVGSGKAEGGSEEARKAEIAEFIAAYEKLIERMRGGGKRRIGLLEPRWFEKGNGYDAQERNRALRSYVEAIWKLRPFVAWITQPPGSDPEYPLPTGRHTRDGIHANSKGHANTAHFAQHWIFEQPQFTENAFNWETFTMKSPELERLRQLIVAKNRLWFDYWRVQNWAFLAGDRTEQPSSRDHIDRTQRWFPAEREAFLPLIAAKERDIDALAAQLAKP